MSKISRNYIYNLSYQILVLITPLITTPYISRTLGANGVGIYSFCYSVEAYFAIFAALGMQVYGQLKIAEFRDDNEKLSDLFSEIIGVKVVIATAITLLYLIYVQFLTSLEYKNVFLLLTINVIATFFDISWFYQGVEEFKKIVLRNYIIKITSIILIFSYVKTPDDILIYTLILQGSVLLGNFSLWVGIKKRVTIKKHKLWNGFAHIKYSFVYFIPTLANTLYGYLDKSMIGFLTSSNVQNGYYEQAYKIENICITLIISLSVVIMPRVAYLYGQNSKEDIIRLLSKSSSAILMLSIPVAVGIFMVAPAFIPWFLGEEFKPTISVLRILSFLIIIDSIKDFYGTQVLMPLKRQTKYNIVMIIGVIINLVFNYFLIKAFMANGAGIASIISETFVMVSFTIIGKDIIHPLILIKNCWKYIVSAIAMAGIVYAISLINISIAVKLFIQLFVGGGVYLVFLLILGERLIKSVILKIKFI